MQSKQEEPFTRSKKIFAALCITGLMLTGSSAFAQTPPAGPPPPPPSPSEAFNKINPFKKKKKDTAKTPASAVGAKPPVAPATTPPATLTPAKGPGGPPPPPPNPLDLFRKKKKADTVRTAPATPVH